MEGGLVLREMGDDEVADDGVERGATERQVDHEGGDRAEVRPRAPPDRQHPGRAVDPDDGAAVADRRHGLGRGDPGPGADVEHAGARGQVGGQDQVARRLAQPRSVDALVRLGHGVVGAPVGHALQRTGCVHVRPLRAGTLSAGMGQLR